MFIRFRYFSKFYYTFLLLILVIVFGIAGFMLVECFTFTEALYMTIITISTVGFSEVHPLSEAGRLFTSFLIITSFGTFAFAVTTITKYLVDGEYIKFIKNYRMNKEIEKLKNHVIVCGYGRNGKQVATTLAAYKQTYVIVEKSEEIINIVKENKEVFYITGDATVDDHLIKAGVAHAKALISTLPNDADNLYVVLTARELNPDMLIVSRASDDRSDKKLRIAGADNVIMPDKVGGEHMASLVMIPDVMEFMDQISIQGSGEINLEEITFSNIPDAFKYKTIRELEARYKSGSTIIGFKTPEGKYIINPSPDLEIKPNSKLFVLGSPEQIRKLNSIFGVETPEIKT